MAALNMARGFSGYLWGIEQKKTIAREMGQLNNSRFTMEPEDGGILAALAVMCPGDYFEIGMLQGGSAILVAMAKQFFGVSGNVYGCDPFGWGPGQTQAGPEPSVETVLRNAEEFGVANLVTPYRHAHPPLPEALAGKRFDVTFIDGNHTYEAAKADWEAAKEYTDMFILFHDIHMDDPMHGAVHVWHEATKEDDWEFFYQAGKMGVVKRVDNR